MFGMNQEQVMGLVRQFLLIAGTLAATLGWATPEKVASWTATILSLVGPIFMVTSVVWSAVNKTQANLITAAAKQTDPNGVPIVKAVTINPLAQGAVDIARATPSNVNIATTTATMSGGGGGGMPGSSGL